MRNIEIWWDAESLNGRGNRSEHVERSNDVVNISAEPCVDCSMWNNCRTTHTCCKAFRTYVATGKFDSTNISRLINKVK